MHAALRERRFCVDYGFGIAPIDYGACGGRRGPPGSGGWRRHMSEPAVIRTESEGILELVLNRPDKLNALNGETLSAIGAAIEDLRQNDMLRVMLIRANGRYFSAGADLSEFGGSTPQAGGSKARDWFRRGMGGMQAMWQELELVEKPVVVAHHATCVGGGLELSLSCDFRLAARSARYHFPEMKMAMLPASGGISRLTRLCGPHWAKWMLMANEKVDAERALAMGLVHHIYPDESFESDVRDFCRRLAAQPPEAMAMAKLSIELAADLESASARQLERLVLSNLVEGQESKDMMARHKARLFGGGPG
ncbi:enoyl-CoA hydratase/isomerase family protein [Sphingomonas flavalba]|uniref:enoyl-CoA hydratase/isomerase family protein n=1 Tax=Sphingomonas flavalba TaxID=2559804 RepID=UPI0039DFB58C